MYYNTRIYHLEEPSFTEGVQHAYILPGRSKLNCMCAACVYFTWMNQFIVQMCSVFIFHLDEPSYASGVRHVYTSPGRAKSYCKCVVYLCFIWMSHVMFQVCVVFIFHQEEPSYTAGVQCVYTYLEEPHYSAGMQRVCASPRKYIVWRGTFRNVLRKAESTCKLCHGQTHASPHLIS